MQTMPRIASLGHLSRTRHTRGKDLFRYSNMGDIEYAESIVKTILGRRNMTIDDRIRRRTVALGTMPPHLTKPRKSTGAVMYLKQEMNVTRFFTAQQGDNNLLGEK